MSNDKVRAAAVAWLAEWDATPVNAGEEIVMTTALLKCFGALRDALPVEPKVEPVADSPADLRAELADAFANFDRSLDRSFAAMGMDRPKVEPAADSAERNDTFARSLEFRLPELDAVRADLAAMTAERDAALKQRDYNREVIARRNVTLARSEATLAAMTAERNDALERESKVVEYAAKIQAERNAALAQIAETNTAFDVVLARVETNAKDAHMGRWVNNNLRRLVALHRGDTTASKDAFYDSVSQQLKQLDAILGKGAK